jgi:hypothetical protein
MGEITGQQAQGGGRGGPMWGDVRRGRGLGIGLGRWRVGFGVWKRHLDGVCQGKGKRGIFADDGGGEFGDSVDVSTG